MRVSDKLKDQFWYIAIVLTLKKLAPQALSDLEDGDFEVIKSVYEKSGNDWAPIATGDLQSWQELRSACKSFLKIRGEDGKRPFDKVKESE